MNRFALMLLLLSTVAGAQNFPPCTSQYVNEVWRDPSGGGFYYCDGKNWWPIATDGGSSGGLGLCSEDAGILSCKRFTSTDNSTTTVLDGGANFLCSNNPATSSMCVWNQWHTLEIGGQFSNPATTGQNAASVILCDTTDGGRRQYASPGSLYTFSFIDGCGTSDLTLGGMASNGDWHTNGNYYLDGISPRIIAANGAMYIESNGAFTIWNTNASGDIFNLFGDPGGTQVLDVHHDGSLKGYSTKLVGTITLSGGTGTATVNSGAKCVCTDTSATPLVLQCAVSSTTLTATQASGSHVIAYVCM
jgi:hypothetical protein